MKEYTMNLSKRYKVTFIKDGVFYKKGNIVEVNMPTAAGFFKEGKIEVTQDLINDAKEMKCEDLFTSKGKKQDL